MIDWKRVGELRDEVGTDDFDEVVDLFLEEVEEVIERLRSAPDPSAFEVDLHFLKGGALNLGFRAFADLCSSGERTAADGAADTVAIGEVIESYSASKAQFLAQLRVFEAA